MVEMGLFGRLAERGAKLAGMEWREEKRGEGKSRLSKAGRQVSVGRCC